MDVNSGTKETKAETLQLVVGFLCCKRRPGFNRRMKVRRKTDGCLFHFYFGLFRTRVLVGY